MNTIVVDDRQLAVNAMLRILRRIRPEGNHQGFIHAEEALEYQKSNPVDVAFLDIEMPEMNGLELIRELRKSNPRINAIIVTGHAEYALDAHNLFVSGYLMKPMRQEDVEVALSHLRFPVDEKTEGKTLPAAPEEGCLLYARCFGNFDAFVGNVPLHFKRTKTKELLAYLVDRQGATCTVAELLSVLWPDRPDNASQRTQLRNLIHDLRSTLAECGCEDVIIRHWNAISVDLNKIDSDYYRYLRRGGFGNEPSSGEYMRQYPWGEATREGLQNP